MSDIVLQMPTACYNVNINVTEGFRDVNLCSEVLQ